ncbi:TonB-dependent receptor [Sphingobium sufflavum]|uniref:TonB-dependent receptor domain-containing protein n=1 Tax=Sphingobium sufflavum TaxID=1129547 RepID=UPI001F3972AB|nr:TonB-dependent receptor [Sphingobium sufflavum]MCE7797228.1 TonB-dependent receptor [Sphingobium sufflavum]
MTFADHSTDRTPSGRTGFIGRRNRAFVALLLVGTILGAAAPASAQTLDELRQSNRRLEEENARLRAALTRQSPDQAQIPGQTTPSAAPSPAAQPAHQTARVERAEEPERAGVGDAQLADAIIVTAQRIKELPKSVSAVTGEELEKFQVNNFRDIANRIGNVRTSWNNPNTASIFIRGVGWAAGAGVLDPSVGVAVDDVSHGISSISALSNYLDVESVEVERGPVGADGLRAANLGRISIHTKRPSFTPSASAAITYGELNTVIATAALTGPIIDDKLAVRISVNRETADGPYANKNDTHYTWRNTDRTNVRAQLLYTPSSRFEALLSFDYTPTGREICENCFAFPTKTPANYDWTGTNGLPGAVDYSNDNFGKIQRRWFAQKSDYTVNDYYDRQINTVSEYPNTYATKGATANLTFNVTDSVKLRSITGWRDYSFSQGAGSHTPFEWLRAPRGTQTSFEQWSQEFRVDAKLDPTLRFRGGLYYYRGKFPNYSQTERYGSDGGAWYATAAQYGLLDPSIAGLPNATDPAGRGLLLNALDGLITQRKERYENESLAAYASLIWDATERLTLSAGARLTHEQRQAWSQSGILSDGFGAELNPASVNNVALNGFNSSAAGVLGVNTAAQLAVADLVAQKYFNVANYAGLTTAQRAQVGAAKAIRLGRLGALYRETAAAKYKATLPTIDLGVTYKITDEHTLHATYKHGEKPGISQIVGATINGGKSVPADTEKTDAYEVGIRSLLFDRALSIGATAFLQDITNYIQPAFVYDEAQTALARATDPNATAVYLSALGNVPKVRTKGIELDVALFAIPYTTVRFAGAYTDARYRSFPRAANPGELGGANPNGAYYDATGKTLAGAPKWSGNLFVDFSYPVGGTKTVHANLNYNYQSGYYADTTLSRYTKTDPWGITDLSVGFGWNKRFDFSVVAKNLFNVDTGLNPSWNQYKPGVPRWLGVIIRAEID